MGAWWGPSLNLSLLVALAFFLKLLFLGALLSSSSDPNSELLLAKYTTLFLTDQLGSFLVEDTTLSESMQPSILIVAFSLVGLTVGAVRRYRNAAARRRARRARGSCDEEMTMQRSGCCESGRQAVSQNWNPLRDHYFNMTYFVQYENSSI